jgi:voltage-gated potassium channel
VAIIVLGSIGYVWIEGWSFFDGLYMTVITLTTVGFGEVHPLTKLGRAYTMVLLFAGMGVMLYVVTSLARVVVEGEIKEALGKRKLAKGIKKLENHYIICGFGRIGEIIARQLKEQGLPLVVVDNNPEQVRRLEEAGYYVVAGDATKEEVLLEAGIERAKGLVAVVASDVGNVYITLTARSLNPKLFIVARAEDQGSQQKGRSRQGRITPRAGGAENGPYHPAPHGGYLYGTGHGRGGGMEHGGNRGRHRFPVAGPASQRHRHPPAVRPHRGGHQAG